ncbi:dihydroorotate dehydrogenase [Methanobrevibacter cuticularis]|uniref:Dihydroorotate dehydrogenase n=1 Tax=Methanobrevibacter cuticularis TaxID=47311 RepID=A0A166DEE4_9EURY|nr:MJ0144 family RNA dihydrouridine synthase-like protein [Methanobrevibacter cuticularis]KZX15508.1 dihydroorotate dehydrogenase [Methanobrevibacter cuticularis]
MAGITDGKFALQLIPYGFDTVTIGGYNTDSKTIEAGEKILKRGRNEFNIPEADLITTIGNEVEIIKDKYDVEVSANLRATTPDPILEISKIKNLDIIELNFHCRQHEILKINCGQSMLENIEFLETFTREIVKKSKSKVSVKIRANVEGTDTLKIAKIIEKVKADYLHIDAMKPGFNHADLDIIKKIANETEIFLIGNNSITSIDRCKKMLHAGASGISIGRAAINGKLNFDFAKI